LDEIQECPQAISSLRYFKEKAPHIPVIGAGSLLEFALQETAFKMPVGRVQVLYLYPLSFSEFLTASGTQNLRDFLSEIKPPFESFDNAIHNKLIELLRLYLVLGGMPAVLKEYFSSKNLLNCQNIQTALLQTYRSDFGKYAKLSQHKFLQKVFDSAPRLIGQRIKYSNIDSNDKSRDLKNALELLILAGVITPIYASSASGLPLPATINERKFKLNFLDTGLMQNACGLQAELGTTNDFIQINSGAVAEQFVGQELKAYSPANKNSDLFFWTREERGSSAEIDFIINIGSDIFPLEVKSAKGGRLKSLKMFLENKKSKFGIKVSQEKPSFHDKLLSLPLYMIEQITRIA